MKKMDDQEKQQYMSALVAKGDGLEGAEAICLAEFQEVVKNLGQASDSLNQARAEVKRLEGVVQILRGKRMAYFDTLIASEEGRRNAANKNLELVPNDEAPQDERKTS